MSSEYSKVICYDQTYFGLFCSGICKSILPSDHSALSVSKTWMTCKSSSMLRISSIVKVVLICTGNGSGYSSSLYFENFAHSWVESSDVLLQLGKDDVVVGFASVANKKHFEKKELVILSTVQAELVEQVGVYTLYKGAHKYYAKKIADLLTSKETCKDTYLGLLITAEDEVGFNQSLRKLIDCKASKRSKEIVGKHFLPSYISCQH